MLNQSKRFIHLLLCLIILFLNFPITSVLAQETKLSPEQVAWEKRMKDFDSFIYKAAEEGSIVLIMTLKVETPKVFPGNDEEYKQYVKYNKSVVENFLKKHEQLRSKAVVFSNDASLSVSLNSGDLASIKYDRDIVSYQEDIPDFLEPFIHILPSPKSPAKPPNASINQMPPSSSNYNTERIGTQAAWTAGYTGAGKIIVILDTGVDPTHPSLVGKIAAEACFSGNTPTSSNAIYTSLCPGGSTSSTVEDGGQIS